MLQFILFLTLNFPVDTLPHLDKIRVYNQVGNVHIVRADTYYLKIKEYSTDKNAFQIVKRIKDNGLDIEIKARRSCEECGTDIIIGVPYLLTLKTEITSGNLYVDGNINNTRVSILSGNIRLSGNFKKIAVELLDGKINLENIKVDTLHVSLSRGDLFLKPLKVINKGDVNLLSGSIKLSLPEGQAYSAILTEQRDTLQNKGSGNLTIKITSGKLLND